MTKSAVVLVSGGLDSLTCLGIAKQEGYKIHALSFDYGQRHSAELIAAKRCIKAISVASHRIVDIPMQQIGGSALTDSAIAVPDYQDSDEIPVTYVPARNTIFLSYALAVAEVVKAEVIITGVSCVDYSHYPDCRPEYINAWQQLINLATKATVTGQHIRLYAPLIHLSKAETIKRGMELGVDYSLSVSCYRADESGRACGTCDSCTHRKKGFAQAGVADPTRYKS